MKAELNERNEVVVTMSRGEAQRVANAAWQHKPLTEQQGYDCFDFAQYMCDLGIEFIFTK